MVHIIASFAFSLVALGTLSLIVWMLVEEWAGILHALGLAVPTAARARPAPRIRVRPVSVRQPVTAAAAQPQRAAA
jgi:hypothetical protein